MVEMIAVFEGICEERDTLRRLHKMALDRGKWAGGHSLFQDIRHKKIKAERREDHLAMSQYDFEEKCAKTLYNLSRSAVSFDPDSAFWVIPSAVALGRELGLSEPSQISSLLRM